MPPVPVLRMAMLGEDGARARGAGSNASAATVEPDEAKPVDFSVLATGTVSGYEGVRAVELMTNAEAWRRAWNSVGGGRLLPDVNFDTRAVIVVYQGRRPTGGYSVEITGIKRVGTVLAVSVNERRPASGDITTQVISSPFVAVSIQRPQAGVTVRFEGPEGAVDGTQQNRQTPVKPRARGVGRRRGRRR
ncbi:MAG: protease complex subunit PrcB family protein [Acidobacteria bacterium]|nr:protease complex subunit PrcB family protein [Acidobacteriota bacterium]